MPVTEDTTTMQHTPPPTRDHEQRMDALALANRVRSGRARVKRALRDDLTGLLIVRTVNAPETVAVEYDLPVGGMDTMRVIEALLATRKIGRVKARRLLAAEHISPSKTLGGLTDRQRDAIVAWLTDHAERTRAA
jgi:hypothetical protein